VAMPVPELTSKAYAEKLANSIGEKATPSAELAPFAVEASERDHTTHLSTVDEAGNAVALTYTLEESYGAKCVVAGAGFLLNNERGDFNLRRFDPGWLH
ncbi:MAG: gamma-glutamyltransferase, partial [Solirubrobacteraceae bacterium]